MLNVQQGCNAAASSKHCSWSRNLKASSDLPPHAAVIPPDYWQGAPEVGSHGVVLAAKYESVPIFRVLWRTLVIASI